MNSSYTIKKKNSNSNGNLSYQLFNKFPSLSENGDNMSLKSHEKQMQL